MHLFGCKICHICWFLHLFGCNLSSVSPVIARFLVFSLYYIFRSIKKTPATGERNRKGFVQSIDHTGRETATLFSLAFVGFFVVFATLGFRSFGFWMDTRSINFRRQLYIRSLCGNLCHVLILKNKYKQIFFLQK